MLPAELTDVLAAAYATAVAALPRIALALAATLALLVASRLLVRTVSRACIRGGLPVNATKVVARLTRWGAVLAALLTGLAIAVPSFDAADLIQLAGVAGIALGFAFRDILQNFMAGLLLLATEPFRIGDIIVVDGIEGTVQDIYTRATVIRRYDGTVEVIPNATLFTNNVTVLTAGEARRWEFDFPIAYDADVELARRLVYDALAANELVLDEPAPEVFVLTLADSSVNLRTYWWVAVPAVHPLEVWDQVVCDVRRRFAQHDVEIPFATQTLLLHDRTGSREGDREGAPPASSR